VDPDYAAAHAGKCELFVKGYTAVDDASYIGRAASACGTALELNPNLDVVHTSLGRLYAATGQYGIAEASYRRALQIDPSSVASLVGLGDVYQQQNRPEKAESNLRLAIGLHPGDPLPYNRLGVFLFRSGRFAEAVEQYQHLVALQPDNMNGFSSLGAAFMLMGSFDLAAPAYQKAIEIEPTKTAYSNLGLMHYYLGDLDAAIDSHTSAVELAPNDYLSRSNLGDALWIAGREGDALREFEQAGMLAERTLQVNPNDALTMMDLAWIQAMLNKPDAARTLIDRARDLAPDDPYTHYYDAMVFLRVGDETAALAALQIAADKGYSLQMLAAEPHLAPLRDNPRFSAIVNAG
jgi:tetratricopeptide (TPR) repeat protein